MNKAYLLIIISFLSVNIFAQEGKTAESYQLNSKKDKLIGSFSCKMKMKNTEKGSMDIAMGDQSFKGIVNLFEVEVETKDIYKKNTITREFVKKRRKTLTELNGQVMTNGDDSGIEGNTAKFAKKKGKWELQNSSDFTEFGLKYLNEFYDPTKKESEMIIYPDNMKVGETRKLTDKNFPKPSQTGETNTGSGTVRLIRVEKVKGDRIAVLELDFMTESLNKIEKDETKTITSFKGIVRRSLDTFVDTHVDMDCTMNMTQSQHTDDGPAAIVSIAITARMEASCKVL